MDLRDMSQDEFEKIEAYLNGKLEPTDLIEFEAKLENDSNFKTKVEDIKTVLSGIETQALKEQLNVFHDDLEVEHIPNEGTETKVRSIQWKKLAIAAVFIIAAGSFWFYNGNSNESLYNDYFTPDPGLPTTMSSNSNYEFYDAMVNYKQGEYKIAISKWETLQKAKPNNDTLNYFIGVAHLANKNENKAIMMLNSVIKQNKSVFINDAYYYLGLAHLKTDNLELAKKNFNISSTEDSKALLSELTD